MVFAARTISLSINLELVLNNRVATGRVQGEPLSLAGFLRAAPLSGIVKGRALNEVHHFLPLSSVMRVSKRSKALKGF